MTSYKQSIPRAEFVRKRRSPENSRGERGSMNIRRTEAVERKDSLASRLMPVKPTVVKKQNRQYFAGSRASRQYEFTFSSANARVRAPAISLPQFNMRWVSAALTAVLLFAMYTIWNAASFTISSSDVTGNIRLGSEQIYEALRMNGESVFKVVPTELENTLRNSFTDLEAVDVKVLFPNHIVITVVERIPVLDWYQDDARALIDINGVAFPPRSAAEGLIVVYAEGTPPQVPAVEGEQAYEHPYVQPEMVEALIMLLPSVPAGMPVIYDPEYGIGWQDDARGWQVYFGGSTEDIQAKLIVYEAVAEAMVREGKYPQVISVAHLDTPFIK